jgi:hypothetical protein
MRPRIFIAWLLVFVAAALLQSASALGSWNTFGTYTTADFYNPHLGLVGTNGQGGLIQRYEDGFFTGVFATAVTQVVIQDSLHAWATDGDSLYLGKNGWFNWQTVLGHPDLTLVRATPGALFVYSDSDLYRTSIGDTSLMMAQGILHGDSITAIDYISPLSLVAVSSTHIYISKDGGETWNRVAGKMKGDASIFVDTTHHLIYTGGDSLRVSSDSGMTWSIIMPPPEFGISYFTGQVFGARDCSGTFYIANTFINGSVTDIMRSQDQGNTFEGVSSTPFLLTDGPATKGWVFDRGSTVILGLRYFTGDLKLAISHDGTDGLIPDSVASAITVSVGTIYDTICAVPSVPFSLTVSSSICTGVVIDRMSVVHSSGAISKTVTPHTLYGNATSYQLSYSGNSAGVDSIVLQLWFHSLEWGFEEHVNVPVLAYSISLPAELETTDSLSFGNVQALTSRTLPIQIVNSGCAPLRVDSLVSSNLTLFSISSMSFPFFVKQNATTKINVTFSPLVAGPVIESAELGTSAGHMFIELKGVGTSTPSESVDASSDQNGLAVFPDPAASVFTVRGVEENAQYALIDPLGRSVQNGWMEGKTISVSRLPEGMYLLRCGTYSARIIVAGR